jgi:hypothetical protein
MVILLALITGPDIDINISGKTQISSTVTGLQGCLVWIYPCSSIWIFCINVGFGYCNSQNSLLKIVKKLTECHFCPSCTLQPTSVSGKFPLIQNLTCLLIWNLWTWPPSMSSLSSSHCSLMCQSMHNHSQNFYCHYLNSVGFVLSNLCLNCWTVVADNTSDFFLMLIAFMAFHLGTNCIVLRQPHIQYVKANIHNKVLFFL